MNIARLVEDSRGFLVTVLGTILLLLTTSPSFAQRPKPAVYGVFGGDTCYTVLPPGAIPAIENPVFVSGDSADAQMSPEEPVLGILYKGEAKAYSLWHLDDHEIVNDTISGTAIAATW